MIDSSLHSDDRAEIDAPGPPDEAELVGPGRFPLRIQPAAALMPGDDDPKRLLTVWYLRKCFYWIFFLGFAYGSIAAAIRHEDNELNVDWTSPDSVSEGLLSPYMGVIASLILRFGVGWIALAMCVPLAVAHEPNLSPRTNFGSGIGKFFDRMHVARAFRALRWTHHVRQVALARLGPKGRRVGRLDPLLDVVNIASGVLAFLTIATLAALTNG